jgi:hypothetical protein
MEIGSAQVCSLTGVIRKYSDKNPPGNRGIFTISTALCCERRRPACGVAVMPNLFRHLPPWEAAPIGSATIPLTPLVGGVFNPDTNPVEGFAPTGSAGVPPVPSADVLQGQLPVAALIRHVKN